MKIYNLPQLCDAKPDGAYLLGPEDLKTNAAYLLYGRLRPRETDRAIAPREGCEEIICVIKGRLSVRRGRSAFSVGPGEAFLLNTGAMRLDNPHDDEAVYIAAGGRSAAAVKEEKALPAPEARDTAAAKTQPPPPPEPEEEFDITTDDAPGQG